MGAKGNDVNRIYLGICKTFDLEARSVLRKSNNAESMRYEFDGSVCHSAVCCIFTIESITQLPEECVGDAASRQVMMEMQRFLQILVN